MVVAAYVEELTRALSPASVKQHLAALRMLFDWLVVGQVLPFNPASSVRGPQACRQNRQDPGSLREGDPGPPRRHRRLDPGGPSRPRVPWRPRLQLRARERRGLASRRRLLHPGADGRSSGSTRRAGGTTWFPPTTRPRSLRRRLPRGRPDRRGPPRTPLSELPSPVAARPSSRPCDVAGEAHSR